MKIIIAPDSFKGALRSPEVCEALKSGWLSRRDQDEVLTFPLADGGEGTCEALVKSTGGSLLQLRASDPLMRQITCCCGIVGDGRSAVMELAAASGIELLKREELDPLKSTTYGSGEVMKCLLDQGRREFVLGIGGSATVDGGAGMLQALGAEFFDCSGNILPPGIGGGALKSVARISLEKLDPRLKECSIQVACDVTNPLLGPGGLPLCSVRKRGQLLLWWRNLRKICVTGPGFAAVIRSSPEAVPQEVSDLCCGQCSMPRSHREQNW